MCFGPALSVIKVSLNTFGNSLGDSLLDRNHVSQKKKDGYLKD